MSCNCNCNNGKTFINSVLPVPKSGTSSTSTTYVFDLTHYLCGNKKICISAAYPLSASLSYQIQEIVPVGNNAYDCTILCTGECTYMPSRCGCNNKCGCDSCCNTCPRADFLFCQFTIPLASSAIPNITSGLVKCSPANVKDCCNTTNAVSIVSSIKVGTNETTAPEE